MTGNCWRVCSSAIQNKRFLQLPYPDIPEPHFAAMVLQQERLLRTMRRVSAHPGVRRAPGDLLTVVHHHAVVEYRYKSRLDHFLPVEFRRFEDDVECLPLARLAGHIH